MDAHGDGGAQGQRGEEERGARFREAIDGRVRFCSRRQSFGVVRRRLGYNVDMTSDLAEHSLDKLSIDTLRLLAVDTVEKAKSGHPGAPLGCAPIAYLLFHKLMKHNPKN